MDQEERSKSDVELSNGAETESPTNNSTGSCTKPTESQSSQTGHDKHHHSVIEQATLQQDQPNVVTAQHDLNNSDDNKFFNQNQLKDKGLEEAKTATKNNNSSAKIEKTTDKGEGAGDTKLRSSTLPSNGSCAEQPTKDIKMVDDSSDKSERLTIDNTHRPLVPKPTTPKDLEKSSGENLSVEAPKTIRDDTITTTTMATTTTTTQNQQQKQQPPPPPHQKPKIPDGFLEGTKNNSVVHAAAPQPTQDPVVVATPAVAAATTTSTPAPAVPPDPRLTSVDQTPQTTAEQMSPLTSHTVGSVSVAATPASVAMSSEKQIEESNNGPPSVMDRVHQERAPLADTYAPYIIASDTSLHDARQRLQTALEQTRQLRAAFTERVYGKYRVCLRPPPPTQAILNRIHSDPSGTNARLKAQIKALKEEKEIEKKEAQKLNAEMTANGAGTSSTASLNADNAEQLMFISAGLSLVIPPEEDVDTTQIDMSSYKDRAPINAETGQRVRSISAAAAAAGEVILDRARKASAMRTERNKWRKQNQAAGEGPDIDLDGNLMHMDLITPVTVPTPSNMVPSDNISVMPPPPPPPTVLPTTTSVPLSQPLHTTITTITKPVTPVATKISKRPSVSKLPPTATAAASSSSKSSTLANSKANRARVQASMSVSTLLSLNAPADELKVHNRPCASTCFLIEQGVGSQLINKTTQHKQSHPFPDSAGGRQFNANLKITASGAPKPLESYSHALPPLPQPRPWNKRKSSLRAIEMKDNDVTTGIASTRHILGQFCVPKPSQDGDNQNVKHPQKRRLTEISALFSIHHNDKSYNSNPAADSSVECSTAESRVPGDPKNLRTIDPILTLSVLEAIGLVGSSFKNETGQNKLPSLVDVSFLDGEPLDAVDGELGQKPKLAAKLKKLHTKITTNKRSYSEAFLSDFTNNDQKLCVKENSTSTDQTDDDSGMVTTPSKNSEPPLARIRGGGELLMDSSENGTQVNSVQNGNQQQPPTNTQGDPQMIKPPENNVQHEPQAARDMVPPSMSTRQSNQVAMQDLTNPPPQAAAPVPTHVTERPRWGDHSHQSFSVLGHSLQNPGSETSYGLPPAPQGALAHQPSPGLLNPHQVGQQQTQQPSLPPHHPSSLPHQLPSDHYRHHPTANALQLAHHLRHATASISRLPTRGHHAAGDLAEYIGGLHHSTQPPGGYDWSSIGAASAVAAAHSSLAALGINHHRAALVNFSVQDRARALIVREHQTAAAAAAAAVSHHRTMSPQQAVAFLGRAPNHVYPPAPGPHHFAHMGGHAAASAAALLNSPSLMAPPPPPPPPPIPQTALSAQIPRIAHPPHPIPQAQHDPRTPHMHQKDNKESKSSGANDSRKRVGPNSTDKQNSKKRKQSLSPERRPTQDVSESTETTKDDSKPKAVPENSPKINDDAVNSNRGNSAVSDHHGSIQQTSAKESDGQSKSDIASTPTLQEDSTNQQNCNDDNVEKSVESVISASDKRGPTKIENPQKVAAGDKVLDGMAEESPVSEKSKGDSTEDTVEQDCNPAKTALDSIVVDDSDSHQSTPVETTVPAASTTTKEYADTQTVTDQAAHAKAEQSPSRKADVSTTSGSTDESPTKTKADFENISVGLANSKDVACSSQGNKESPPPTPNPIEASEKAVKPDGAMKVSADLKQITSSPEAVSTDTEISPVTLTKTAGMRFVTPSPPAELSPDIASLVIAAKPHEALRKCDLNGPSPDVLKLLEFLIAVGSAVPIPKSLVANNLKEKISLLPTKNGNSSGIHIIPRDAIVATILLWLWAHHEASFQQAFVKSGRIDVDPKCKWLIQASVDTTVKVLSRHSSGGVGPLVTTLAKLRTKGSTTPKTISDVDKPLYTKVEALAVSVVSRALSINLALDETMDNLLPNFSDAVEYLDECRKWALQSKSQERALLAALIARKTTMSLQFSHAYVSSMVRAGDALGHGELFEVVQNEDVNASTMIPYDVFTDESGAWEDPCRPPEGFTPNLTGDDLMRRAHARAMIHKSLKKLQDRHEIKGGTTIAGPYAEPGSAQPGAKSDTSGGKSSSSGSVSTPRGFFKRQRSFTEPPVTPGTGSAAAKSWSLYDPRHYSAPLPWEPEDVGNTPYGRYLKESRPRSISLTQMGLLPEKGKRGRNSRSTSISSTKGANEGTDTGQSLGNTREIAWEDIAKEFQQVQIPRPQALKEKEREKSVVAAAKTIFAPFVRIIDDLPPVTSDGDESDGEEDLSDEAVLDRHQNVLDGMKEKLAAFLEARKKQQERRKSREKSR